MYRSSKGSLLVPDRINIAVTPADPNRLYAYTIGKDAGRLMAHLSLYEATSEEWITIEQFIGTGLHILTTARINIAVSPTKPSAMYYGHTKVRGTEDVIHDLPTHISPYTGNGYHADVHALEFSPDGTMLWCGHDGGISVKPMDDPLDPNGWSYKCEGLDVSKFWTMDHSEWYPDRIVGGFRMLEL